MKKSPLDIWSLLALLGLNFFGAFSMFGIRPDLIANYLFFIAAGFIAFFVAYRAKIDILEQNYKLWYLIFIVLLFATLIFAATVRGSQRWIDLYFFRFQTSEFFKPVFLIVMAAVLSSTNRFTPRKLVIILGLFLVPVLLIFRQPDLGSVILYSVVFINLMYFSGLSSKTMVRFGSIALAALPFSWIFLKNYQKARIIGFINPEIDPQGLTYNLNQAIITIGSGGFWGKGLGLGTQARHRFLPEFHTDFAFASLIEQFGFTGGLIIIVLYGVLLFRLVKKIFEKKENMFSYLFLIGVVTFLSFELLVNIGMNLGLMPVTGIALPFISYGGSSIVSTMILLGLAFSI